MARALGVFQERAAAAQSLTERVTENIRRVAMAATQASSAISQVSDGSNIQLKSLQQSASALDQSAAAIAEVARSTQSASEQANTAAHLVTDGIGQMGTMVEVVTAISENSTQINQIAGAISRIASQTNMLALNAAIEAARAGEHGKGFAVVAEEVRKLAENSGGLAEEISGLVQNATTEADRGVAMVQQVSGNMRQIADAVQQNDRLVGAVATAMEEQQATVNGINSNVAELTRIGQSNATAAEEITATMIDLSKLAERSRIDVEEFRASGPLGVAGRAGKAAIPNRAGSATTVGCAFSSYGAGGFTPMEETLRLLQEAMRAHRAAIAGTSLQSPDAGIAAPKIAVGDTRGVLVQRLARDVERVSGIEIGGMMEARLGRVLATVSLAAFEAWVDRLHRLPSANDEWLSLIESPTVHETFFHRDRSHLELLRHGLLPPLIAAAARDGTHRLRFWSAGCATGEEAYTLAIVGLLALRDAGSTREEADGARSPASRRGPSKCWVVTFPARRWRAPPPPPTRRKSWDLSASFRKSCGGFS